MSEEENKALVRRFNHAIYKQRDLSIIDQVVSSNFMYHHASGRDLPKEAYTQTMTGSLNAFSNSQLDIEDLFTEGNKVACLFTIKGIHSGEFQGIPPTGNKITQQIMEIYRIDDNKIAEIWSKYNTLNQMQQLGVIPPRGKR